MKTGWSKWTIENAAFQAEVRKLEAAGYDVYLQPPKDILPEFLRDLVPDAVALPQNGGKNIAIEMAPANISIHSKVAELGRLFEGRRDWDFRVIHWTPMNEEVTIKPISGEELLFIIVKFESSIESADTQASFLMAWSIFEACSRAIMPNIFQRPQSAKQVIEIMAREGYIVPSEAKFLRSIVSMRNNIAHGGLDFLPKKQDVEKIIDICKNILRQMDNK